MNMMTSTPIIRAIERSPTDQAIRRDVEGFTLITASILASRGRGWEACRPDPG